MPSLRQAIAVAQYGYHAYKYSPRYYLAYRAANMYLRGTVKKAFASYANPKPPTLGNKVLALQRKVAKLRPELQHFIRNNNGITSAGSSILATDFDVTRNLIDAAEFRQTVTGDKFVIKGLRFRAGAATAIVDRMRVIVYSPTRSGTSSVTWANNLNDFVHVMDPLPNHVLFDRTYTPYDYNIALVSSFYVPLNRTCLYNSTLDILDKNNIRIAIICQFQSALTDAVKYSYDLSFVNK